jgi:hypothetical protein
MADKLKVAEQAEIRADLYKIALGALQENGMETEVVSKGAIIHLVNGQYARMQISYCDPTKFNLEKERLDYQDKLDKRAERAEKAAQKAREKAERAKK